MTVNFQYLSQDEVSKSAKFIFKTNQKLARSKVERKKALEAKITCVEKALGMKKSKMNKLIQENGLVYLAQIQEIKGHQKEGFEGWNEYEMLPLRITTIADWCVQQKKITQEKCISLLAMNVFAYHVTVLNKPANADKLASDIVSYVGNGSPALIPSGYTEHSINIELRSINETHF